MAQTDFEIVGDEVLVLRLGVTQRPILWLIPVFLCVTAVGMWIDSSSVDIFDLGTNDGDGVSWLFGLAVMIGGLVIAALFAFVWSDRSRILAGRAYIAAQNGRMVFPYDEISRVEVVPGGISWIDPGTVLHLILRPGSPAHERTRGKSPRLSLAEPDDYSIEDLAVWINEAIMRGSSESKASALTGNVCAGWLCDG